MIQINDENYPVYLMDTWRTIKSRVASKLKTLAKFIVFDPPLNEEYTFTGNDSFTVVNLTKNVLNQSGGLIFPEINTSNVIKKQLYKLFIASHSQLNVEKTQAVIMLHAVNDPVRNLFGYKDDFTIFLDQKETILEEYINELREQIQTTSEFERIAIQLEGKPEQNRTEYVPESIVVENKCGVYTLERIQELFDKIHATRLAPYISFNSMHKLYNTFVPSKAWVDSAKANIITIKINSEKDFTRDLKNPYKKYNTVYIYEKNSELILTFDLHTGLRNITREEFIARIMDVIPLELSNGKIVETYGSFAFPAIVFINTIWADLVTNNKLFYNTIAILENHKLAKKKKNIYMGHLNGPERISMQHFIASSQKEFPEITQGELYVKVRIKNAHSSDAVTKLQKILSKYMTIYLGLFHDIARTYAQFIPSFFIPHIIQYPRKEKPKTLLGQEPQIFTAGYSTSCKSDRQPVIISDEEALTTDKEVLVFPAHNESEPRNYICLDPANTAHKYPGLISNNTNTKFQFPAIPCCFKKNPKLNPNSKLNRYLQSQEIFSSETTREVFVTEKILKPGASGFIPDALEIVFDSLLFLESKVERRGVSQTRTSALESVLYCLDLFQSTTLEGKKNEMQQYIDNLSKPELIACCKQNILNKTTDEILLDFNTKTIDILHYYRLFEEYFNCTIYIFGKEKNGKESILVPPHKGPFLHYLPTADTVIFLYRHF